MIRSSMRSTLRPRLAVVAVVASLGAVSACTGAPGSTSTTTMPQSSAAAPSTMAPDVQTAPLETLSSHRLSPVYWLGERDATVYLYREFLETQDLGDPVDSAITHMLEHQPDDPDYFNLWSKATNVGTSIGPDNVITVDLSADAFSRPLDEGLAERAVQQLVYTATAAAANAGLLGAASEPRVAITVDGHSGYQAFGHIELGRPMARTVSLRAPVWLIEPHEGAQYPAGELQLYGLASDFPRGLRWEARNPDDGGVVAGGAVPVGSADLPDGEFQVSTTLGPGTYDVAVWGVAADATRLSEDTKRVEVAPAR